MVTVSGPPLSPAGFAPGAQVIVRCVGWPEVSYRYVVVDRAVSGCPGAAYAVVALLIVLWSADSTFVVWLREPSAPVIVTLVIRPNVPS